MSIPGPKISATLQERTDTQNASTGKITTTWADVVTFQATFGPIRAEEQVMFDKQTTKATHRLMSGYTTVGAANAAKMVEKNRIVIDSTNYDITGAQDFDAGPIGHHWELELKLVT